MIRTPLTYHRPDSTPAAAWLLGEHREDASVLAGGTMLVPLMSRGQRVVRHLIDLAAAGVDGIRAADGMVHIGARATYSKIATSQDIERELPVLARVAAGITGGAQVRNVGTLGGSACYANPSSDGPGVLVALGARMVVLGPAGERRVDAASFFTGAFRTALAADELLVAIEIPAGQPRCGYHKLKLCTGSWPIVTATATVAAEGWRAVTLGGVCETPLRVELDPVESADTQLQARIRQPWSDELADGEYRRAVAGAIARRALAEIEGG
ncbi:MAG TPA: FAD binding domain-containing protein [Solirubrobacteraceae bacterium]|jgi:CO/xanthine dehydrogenase FAD-binding subunit|nr:FAD binding domain-containing protein [Solirubrobacteraceae bacterium]